MLHGAEGMVNRGIAQNEFIDGNHVEMHVGQWEAYQINRRSTVHRTTRRCSRLLRILVFLIQIFLS